MLKSFDELLELAVKKGPKKLAVAVAEDKEVLGAVGKAKKLGIADAILVGNSKKIEKVAEEIGLDLSLFEVIDESDGEKACRTADRKSVV